MTELVKKVFLTSSQTRSASLGSRLKKVACRCAHNLCANCAQIPHLRRVVCFVRRTRRRTKRMDTLFRRARRNSTRFFDRLSAGTMFRRFFSPRRGEHGRLSALPHSCAKGKKAPQRQKSLRGFACAFCKERLITWQRLSSVLQSGAGRPLFPVSSHPESAAVRT